MTESTSSATAAAWAREELFVKSRPTSPSDLPDAREPRIVNSLGFALRSAEQVSTSLWRTVLEGRLTIPQFSVMTALKMSPRIGHYELADLSGIDRATIGPILKRLVEQGYVHRETDPRDSRRAVLQLLTPGTHLLRECESLVSEVNSALMAPLPAAERSLTMAGWTVLAESGEVPQPAMAGSSPADVDLSVRTDALFELRKARRRHRRLWNEHVGEDLGSSQYALMDVIAAQPGLDIRTAAQRASVEETTAVRIVMRLARTRLLRDSRDPNDARRTLLAPSETGMALRLSRRPATNSVERALADGLTVDAFDLLVGRTRLVARLEPIEPELARPTQ